MISRQWLLIRWRLTIRRSTRVELQVFLLALIQEVAWLELLHGFNMAFLERESGDGHEPVVSAALVQAVDCLLIGQVNIPHA